MSFVCYRLSFNNTSFNVSFIKTLAKDNDNFPMIFYKNSYKIEGYFFFNCPMSSVFLRKFCTDVVRMNEDSVSSWYLNEGGHIKYYTNNYYFIDDYINMSRVNVVDMFNYNSNF